MKAPVSSSSCHDLRKMRKARPPPARPASRGWTEGLVQASRSGASPRMSSRPKETRVEPTGPCGPGRPPRRLLQFDDRALRFELLSNFFGFLLGHAFLHGPGRSEEHTSELQSRLHLV